MLISSWQSFQSNDATIDSSYNQTLIVRSYKVKLLDSTNTVWLVKSYEPNNIMNVYDVNDTVMISKMLHEIKPTPKAVKAVVLKQL